MRFSKIEIELSSKCNAACPGCKRVDLLRKHLPFEQVNLDFNTIKKAFDNYDVAGTEIYLCGVLGDPMVHPEVVPITEYFLNKGSKVSISTNGSLRPVEEWQRLGELSKLTGKLEVKFAVDGLEDTNHIYRVNTDWSKIKNNMQAYSNAGGKGNWIFITFVHNKHQVDIAKQQAESLNFSFSLRQSTRNSDPFYMTEATRKQYEQVGKEQYVIHRSTSDINHPYLEKYNQLGIQKPNAPIERVKNRREYAKRKPIPKDFVMDDENKIKCKFVHEKEIFITATGLLWPCCFLWDEYLRYQEFYKTMNDSYGIDWIDLKANSIDSVVQHEYYTHVLEKSWDIKHPMMAHRCWISCGVNGNLRNYIKQLS